MSYRNEGKLLLGKALAKVAMDGQRGPGGTARGCFRQGEKSSSPVCRQGRGTEEGAAGQGNLPGSGRNKSLPAREANPCRWEAAGSIFKVRAMAVKHVVR